MVSGAALHGDHDWLGERSVAASGLYQVLAEGGDPAFPRRIGAEVGDLHLLAPRQ